MEVRAGYDGIIKLQFCTPTCRQARNETVTALLTFNGRARTGGKIVTLHAFPRRALPLPSSLSAVDRVIRNYGVRIR